MKKVFQITVSLLLASTFFIDLATSECCYPQSLLFWKGLTKCLDGTDPTPFCGYRPCNVFGCNCDGGCRKAAVAARSELKEGEDSFPSLDGFRLVDKNRDGKISLKEITKHMLSGRYIDNSENPTAIVDDNFIKMDLNSDGFLSREEIDPSASKFYATSD